MRFVLRGVHDVDSYYFSCICHFISSFIVVHQIAVKSKIVYKYDEGVALQQSSMKRINENMQESQSGCLKAFLIKE